ncbi:DUF5615 family PIN-like protein [Mycolicibacter longobardus]|uniref:DUF5615 domain-containing protein n=1 Tax=Mycolicibacter longobardus TaxID=1108812 RepID=A0A1X1YE87_9MYCO|nr:DUF5615 family PIN-like protein [Mycolicibacter longobardus]ORW09442.1 hypothetical protein AWC16_16650 [Mycolicibacter longobardus]
MKVLLDEMYPAALAEHLKAVGLEVSTVSGLGLAGQDDLTVFAAAVAGGFAVLTENVSDFTRIAAEHIASGYHHHGLLIALAARFSRRPSGVVPLAAAVAAMRGEQLADRTVFLKPSVAD